MCKHCIAAHGITPVQHCPFGLQLQEALSASYGLPATGPERTMHPPETLMAPFRSTFPTNGRACAACGCGDNTIGHWPRWCIVPLLVAWILAQPGHSWATLNDMAVNSRRTATICRCEKLVRRTNLLWHIFIDMGSYVAIFSMPETTGHMMSLCMRPLCLLIFITAVPVTVNLEER